MKYIKYVLLLILLITFYIYLYNSFPVINKEDSLEDYLLSVVACEMPAEYEEEALKAQVVASRTYYYYKIKYEKKEVTSSDQCTITENEMKEKWASKYDYYKNKILKCINETKDEVIKKNNKLLKTYYFSTSNGYTEDSISVFGEDTIKSVESSFDKNSSNYKVTTSYTKEELTKLLGNFNEIKILSRNETNHVVKVSIDTKTISGIEFRKLLKLRSTDFEINIINEKYEITTYGYGHDVGMSQYGSNYLAKNNYSYKDILAYYYGSIIIEKL